MGDSFGEETTVIVELTGLPNPEFIHKCEHLSVLGLDTTEPILQLDNYTFKGNYEDILGTCLIFSQDKGPKLCYSCKSFKKLKMSAVVLQRAPEAEQVTTIQANSSHTDSNIDITEQG